MTISLEEIALARGKFDELVRQVNNTQNINKLRKERPPVFDFDGPSKHERLFPLYLNLKEELGVDTYHEFSILFESIFDNLDEELTDFVRQRVVIGKLGMSQDKLDRISGIRSSYENYKENFQKNMERYERNKKFVADWDANLTETNAVDANHESRKIWNDLIDSMKETCESLGNKFSSLSYEMQKSLICIHHSSKFAFFEEDKTTFNVVTLPTGVSVPLIHNRQYRALGDIQNLTVSFMWDELRQLNNPHVMAILDNIKKQLTGDE